MQNKTRRLVQFEITEQPRTALEIWIHQPLPSRLHSSNHLPTRQYARIVKAWVTSIGLGAAMYGTHRLRRTKVSLIYRRTISLRAIQLLQGQTKLESTPKYLGIEGYDALEVAEQTMV